MARLLIVATISRQSVILPGPFECQPEHGTNHLLLSPLEVSQTDLHHRRQVFPLLVGR